MSKPIVIRDFAQLPYLLEMAAAGSSPHAGQLEADRQDPDGTVQRAGNPLSTASPAAVGSSEPGEHEEPDEHDREGPGDVDDVNDLTSLLAALDDTGTRLADLVCRDEAERNTALDELRRYDTLLAAHEEAERVRLRAKDVRAQAEHLGKSAFGTAAREQAAGIADVARRTEAAAAAISTARHEAAQRLADRPDGQRLLAERRRQETEERARAAAAARADRLAQALSDARSALAAGQLAQAAELLEQLGGEHPSDGQVAALRQTVAQRSAMARVPAVEEAVWAARRDLRHRPAEAVARLEALDVDGLPEPVVRERFGE